MPQRDFLHRRVNTGEHGSDFALRDVTGRGGDDQIGGGDVAALAVDHCGVFTVEPGAGRKIVGRSQPPLVFRRRQEPFVLCQRLVIVVRIEVDVLAPAMYLVAQIVVPAFPCLGDGSKW